MKPSEVIQAGETLHRQPVEIEGYAVFSTTLSYMVDSEAIYQAGEPHLGILLNNAALQPIWDAGLSPYAGTMVDYAGHLKLKGTVTHTGFSLLSQYIAYVYKYHL